METYNEKHLREAAIGALAPLMVESIHLLTDAIKELREEMEWNRLARKELAPLEKKLKVLRLEAELEDFRYEREAEREEREAEREDNYAERELRKKERLVRESIADKELRRLRTWKIERHNQDEDADLINGDIDLDLDYQ